MATQSLKAEIESQGITWTIKAEDNGEGGIVFTITPNDPNASDIPNAGDIRGLFLDLSDDGSLGRIETDGILKSDSATDGFKWYKDNAVAGDDISQVQWGENLVSNLGKGANIKGQEPSNRPVEGYEGPSIFDLGIGFGTPGDSSDFINSTTFTVGGITLDDLVNQFVALRLTSTGEDREGSLKLVGKFTVDDSGDKLYQGFTRGSWLNGSRADDLTGLFGNDGVPYYEGLFLDGDTELSFTQPGQDGITYENPTLKEALGLNGGGLNQFAAQSTAAYLNALYLEDDDGGDRTTYPLSKETVLDLTTAVLNEGKLGGTVDLRPYSWLVDSNGTKGFQADDDLVNGEKAMGMNDLTNLFDFYNNFGTNPADFMLNPSPQLLLA